jgi:hypothetical protein
MDQHLANCLGTYSSFLSTPTGIFCATFYHFFAHDTTGIIGTWVRELVPIRLGLDDATFAAVVVSLFMQVTGILQMPAFLGPDFSPFSILYRYVTQLTTTSSSKSQRENESRRQAKQQDKKKQKES